MKKIIKPSFAGGELSPIMFGRVDLTKYQVGAAVMRNFFVDPRGGASTRPGTQFVGRPTILPDAPKPILLPFVFSSDQTYVLELNGGQMRFISQGSYVTDVTKPIIGATTGASTTLNVNAHGFSVGQTVYVDGVQGLTRPNGTSGVNGRQFYIGAVTPNTFTIQDVGPEGGPSYVPIDSSTWSAWTALGTVSRVYEIAHPWASQSFFELQYTQSADVMTVTHPDYPPYDIRRLGHANWQIVQVQYGPQSGPPAFGFVAAQLGAGTGAAYQYAYAVTTVDQEGRESLAWVDNTGINYALNQANANPTYNFIAWAPAPNAYKYRIYKANPMPNGFLGGGPYVFGLIGSTFTTQFTDLNYAPDFSEGPPQSRNPFFDRSIAQAIIAFSGQGYVQPQLVITDATGIGATVSLTSDLTTTASPYGELVAANVVTLGQNYTAPIATVVDAAPLGAGLVLAFSGAWIPNPLGTGFVPAPGSITILSGGQNYHQAAYPNFVQAVAGAQVGTNVLLISISQVQFGRVEVISWAPGTVTPTPTTGLSSTGGSDTLTFTIIGTDTPASGAGVVLTLGGNTNPSCVGYLEQRKVYAGSRAKPSTVWMSRTGQYNNFDVSDPVQDDDAITAALSAQEINIINGMVPVTNGLILLTSGGAYLLNGGGEGNPVTPSTVRAPPQVFSGAQALRPLRVGDRVLYAQARGSAVRDLAYNFGTNNFTGVDISVLSNHLLQERRIMQWAYADEPFKLVWAVRDDGVLLSCTYLKEQEVYGWARHDTLGQIISVASVPEGREDAVYVVVRRYRPGYGFRYVTERFASRNFGANPAANQPARAELAWSVDCGVRHSPATPGTAMTIGEAAQIGAIYQVTVVSGGSGYSGTLIVQIDDVSGTGATVVVTETGGVIDPVAFVTAPGSGYVAPVLTVLDSGGTGSGAILAARLVTTFILTFEAPAFSAADINKVCRVRGGTGVVLSSPALNQLEVDFHNALPTPLPNLEQMILPRVEAGDWSLDTQIAVMSGLDHLNGATVQILADGNVQMPKVVVDGCVTLDQSASLVTAGIGFTAQLQTLRLETDQPTSQGMRKNIIPLHIRAAETRGLQAGQSWDALRPVTRRSDGTPPGVQEPLQDGGGEPLNPEYAGAPVGMNPVWYSDLYVTVEAEWSEEGIVCIQQSWPLPATVLAVMPELMEGDTTE